MQCVVHLYNQLIEIQFLRSSSGFCEKFAGHGGSGPFHAEDSPSAHIVNSGSCFQDLNSSGDLVTQALADLDLSGSTELLSGRGYIDDNQHSMTSCDTAELLRTPSPCVVGSDQETEPIEAGSADVEARNVSTEEHLEKDQDRLDQWAGLSSADKGKSQDFSVQINSASQSLTDIPATSTPKKQRVNGHRLSSDSTQLFEGQYKGSGYHRDGTRVGWYEYCSLFSLFLNENQQELI